MNTPAKLAIAISFVLMAAQYAEAADVSTTGRDMPEEVSATGMDCRAKFDSMKAGKWKCRFRSGRNWEKDWFLDGKKASVTSDRRGITFRSGEVQGSAADHAVLWTKKSFSGDIMIEYDFTRLDSLNRFVEIIYIQAQGSGKEGFDKDILQWRSRREVPAMEKYFNNMDVLHVSYAAYGTGAPEENPHYIRGRRYMPQLGNGINGTELEPEYLEPEPFLPGRTYHLIFIKRGTDIVMRVSDAFGRDDCYWFSAAKFPEVLSGRVGLRQMSARSAHFSNFRIYTREK